MASWVDGPEYAPIERPEDFVPPMVAPLDSPPPHTHPAAGAPTERPEVEPPSQPVADLTSLAANDGLTPRDPHAPFEVVRAIMTDATSAWSATHSANSSVVTEPVNPSWAPPAGAPVSTATLPRPAPPADGLGSGERSILRPAPTQAIQLSGQQYTAAGATVDQDWQTDTEAVPVTFADFLSSLTPGVVISLVIGGILPPLSLLLFVLAFCLTVRITVATSEIRYTFIGATVILSLAAVVLIFAGNDLGSWWNTVGIISVVMCWLVLLVSVVFTFRALQAGEVPPSRRAPAVPRSPWG